MAYATLAQFEIFGLRRDVILPRSRAISLVDVDTDTLGVGAAHGWSGTEPLQFVAGPMAGITPALPGGISASVVYRPLPVDDSDSLFQIAATVGGAAIDVTSVGAGALQVVEQLGPMLTTGLQLWSDLVDEDLISYLGTIPDPVPPILSWVVCKLLAYDLAITQCLVTPAYFEAAQETIAKQADRANELRAMWRAGKLLQRITSDATPNILENGAVTLDDPIGNSASWFSSVDGQEAIS